MIVIENKRRPFDGCSSNPAAKNLRGIPFRQTYGLPNAWVDDPGLTHQSLVVNRLSVDAILAERGAKNVNVNLLRYFYEPATLDSEAQALLQRGMALAMEWATQGLVVPHVSQTIDSTVEAINAGLQSLKAGRGILGKVAVIVDRDLAAGK